MYRNNFHNGANDMPKLVGMVNELHVNVGLLKYVIPHWDFRT